MASNLANIPDHWLWLGLGVFTFVAIKQVSNGLHHIRAVTEIHKPPPPPQPSHLPANPTHQEDAIKTSSLLTLATSPNIDIRGSATKILCHRFYASDSARKLLVRDLKSKDDETKHRAQRAFDLLRASGVLRHMPTSTAREGWRLYEPASRLGVTAEDAQDLRRRRREAVVIHDGDVDRPFTEEDVFMREPEFDADNVGRAAMIALVAPADSASAAEAMEQIVQLNARLGEHVL